MNTQQIIQKITAIGENIQAADAQAILEKHVEQEITEVRLNEKPREIQIVGETDIYCLTTAGKYLGVKLQLDKRTKAYLGAIKQRIAYIGQNNGWDSIEKPLKEANIPYEKIEQIKLGLRPDLGDMMADIFSYQKDGITKYAVEYGIQTAVDDYMITSYVFTQKPRLKDVHTIMLVDEIESFIIHRFGKTTFECWEFGKTTFECWECGHKTHWLDIYGDLSLRQRFEHFQENYCGC